QASPKEENRMSAIVTFLGNLAFDPETGRTPSGHENLKFRALVNSRQGQQEVVTAFNVTAWSGTAKGLTSLAVKGLLAKGARVVVTGTLTSREYQDRNGQTRTSLDVNAHDVQLVNPPKNAQPATYGDEPVDLDSIPF